MLYVPNWNIFLLIINRLYDFNNNDIVYYYLKYVNILVIIVIKFTKTIG